MATKKAAKSRRHQGGKIRQRLGRQIDTEHSEEGADKQEHDGWHDCSGKIAGLF